ncbi:hypothetical protein [Janthinobacterium sp. 64]|uniref:hypothetical protein n=1 Tax=Janthinobacterium sp. 64 TaxID=2035208 RepID=UPI000CB80DF5|nr:hypothetical protein [Janthinobacterium sp. 64]PKB21394.1 hypothetical protein CLU91_1772 [Janthinobacterium sp. 64]
MRIDLARREHDFSLGQRPHGRYIAATIVLHLALFWAATRPVHMRIEHDARVWLQLAPPLPPTRRLIVPAKPDPAPARAPALPSSAASVSPPKEATAPEQDQPQDDALPAEPAPAAPKAAPLTLAQRALQAAGAIDRQLRAEHPQEFVAPPETAHTRLAKGFAQAHAAVKPKWFEAARIELWSAPNDPKRIYRVITATGEYCIYLPDKGNMTLNLSARSGYAGFGEGTAAPCPIRF